MYERMLDKQVEPSFEELLRYSGECAPLWAELDQYLSDHYVLTKTIRFPYGKDYGWSMKYSQKNKHICDVFAENNAFTVFVKITDAMYQGIKDQLSSDGTDVYNRKYPCGDGGWLNYRVLKAEHLEDVKKILVAKVKPLAVHRE